MGTRPEARPMIGDERRDEPLIERIDPETMEILWRVHDANQAAIRFADTKAGAAAGLATVITGWALTALIQASRIEHRGVPRMLLGLALVGLGLAFFLTLGSTLMTILPRRGKHGHATVLGGIATRGQRPADHARPAMYFSEVIQSSEDDYLQALARVDPAQVAEGLARDVWRVARICEIKYVWVARTLWSTAAVTVASLVVLLTLGAMAASRG